MRYQTDSIFEPFEEPETPPLPATPYLCFFHNSESLIEEFNPRDPSLHRGNYPSFYWFSDSFFTHVPPPGRYFYLFLKNPRLDYIQFRARHEGLDFHALYQAFLDYQMERDHYRSMGRYDKYVEAAILMSFSTIEPDLIAEYSETTRLHTIIKPGDYEGSTISLFDERKIPISFIKIPLLVEMLPTILQAFPFQAPERDERFRHLYPDWVPMITEKMGTWM